MHNKTIYIRSFTQLASATKSGLEILYVTKILVSVCVIAVTEIFRVINVTTVTMDSPRALVIILT